MTRADVTTSLQAFVDRAIAASEQGWFEIPFDPEWRSICELGEPAGDISRWQPARQVPPVDFLGLSNALECSVHEDIRAYYGTFWSGSFEANSQVGQISLIQLWNQEDFGRLIENLIGHALDKRRARQPLTVFFANSSTDPELFLSIENESGKVLLEAPGRPPIKVVHESLAGFLDQLEPLNSSPGIY